MATREAYRAIRTIICLGRPAKTPPEISLPACAGCFSCLPKSGTFFNANEGSHEAAEGLREMALTDKQSDLYDQDEAKRRFEAALRGARLAGHKPMTAVPKKRKPSQDKSGETQAI
jgi:hypothetical protein